MTTRSTSKPGPKKSTGSASNKKNTSKNYRTGKNNKNKKNYYQESEVQTELILIGILALAIFLFLCNFGVIGPVGNAISGFMFGVFGFLAYAVPVLIFISAAFGISNQGNYIATMKLVAGVILFLLLGVFFELLSGTLSGENTSYQISGIYELCKTGKNGGGVIGGSIGYFLFHYLGMIGTILVLIVLGIVCLVAITEKSFLGGVKSGSKMVYESAKEDANRRRERNLIRREEMDLRREEQVVRREELEAQREIELAEKQKRMDNKVTGVMLNTAFSKEEKGKEKGRESTDDIHEIMYQEDTQIDPEFDFDKIKVRGIHVKNSLSDETMEFKIVHNALEPIEHEYASIKPLIGGGIKEVMEPLLEETVVEEVNVRQRPVARATKKMDSDLETDKLDINADIQKVGMSHTKQYLFPPISKLKKNEHKNTGDSTKQLKETALRLQQTLNTFGVKVTITDISQGPSVTRYELQPEVGVKVSKIVGLADDIKLNLAATDIRIEAPIPGKAAVGIEVPNKENGMVVLRDLLEADDFRSFPSNLAFAVGKDIGGQTVVTDIAKMPHMLIAGATGSGKSVCINTLIMSILYKAHPDDVKLIMIDPKVVELSVYNGIPHLLIPVVTDPKKASAALHWGVAEMTDRYKKFADYNVRDLKGYNKKLESMIAAGEKEVPSKLPQIVIIVDELADLMMVAPGEVEESICRLAQLARAAGIHLIIATQRPSVDVITGLIKANMPSRVAFSVSSGVDSRTILDMNGAEKLLGKGDMLFYPQGYAKPARVQGAFVSDKEVSDVVDFLKNQAIGNIYSEDVEKQISNMGSSQNSGGSSFDNVNERDSYFTEAGKFIIEKDKASIGMLQRVFKVGFNRAARIMDQLAEAGVVGEEEGTKPRKVLMSMEEFETYVEDYV